MSKDTKRNEERFQLELDLAAYETVVKALQSLPKNSQERILRATAVLLNVNMEDLP